MIDLEHLRERLFQHEREPDATRDTKAAVLVPLLNLEEGWALLFTRRAEGLSTHRGEISFPGGRVDEGETTLQAALRETEEELSLSGDLVEPLGRLAPVTTVVTGYVIEPWVGLIRNLDDLDPNPHEISEVIVVPMAKLLEDATMRIQKFVSPDGIFANPAYDVGPNIIWGATARILSHLLRVINR